MLTDKVEVTFHVAFESKLRYFEKQACHTMDQIQIRTISSFSIFFFLMRQISVLLFFQVAKVCILSNLLKTLKLRRMNLLQDSTCFQVSPKLQTSLDF